MTIRYYAIFFFSFSRMAMKFIKICWKTYFESFCCRNNEKFLQKLHTLHISHTSLCYPPPKMPSSDPLPPKESAIFRKILVSLSLYIGPHFSTFNVMLLIVISRIMTTKNMRLINELNNLFMLNDALSAANICRLLHFWCQFHSCQSDNRLPGFLFQTFFMRIYL